MTGSDAAPARSGPFLLPGGGRDYPMGRIGAVFKADGEETGGAYSISEWWLEPHTKGPGAHSHPEDDVFYVIEGTMSFLLGDRGVDAPRGSFVLAPGGMTHAFENRSDARAGALNVQIPRGLRAARGADRGLLRGEPSPRRLTASFLGTGGAPP